MWVDICRSAHAFVITNLHLVKATHHFSINKFQTNTRHSTPKLAFDHNGVLRKPSTRIWGIRSIVSVYIDTQYLSSNVLTCITEAGLV